jgi:peptide deformylase
MPILQILEFPDPKLRKTAEPVTVFDEKLEVLIEDMLETMYEAEGIGLAATQVDVHKRLLLIDVSENRDSPQVFINPEIEILESELSEYDEGCLSVPGFYETVSRPRMVKVIAQDSKGEKFEQVAKNILATCIQHEIDQRIRSKLEKEHKKPA